MFVEVVDTDMVSDVADAPLSARFCCARLAVGDKSFMNDMDNGPAGAAGGANVGIGSGDGPLPTVWTRNGGGDGELPRLEERGDISKPSGRVIITSWVLKFCLVDHLWDQPFLAAEMLIILS